MHDCGQVPRRHTVLQYGGDCRRRNVVRKLHFVWRKKPNQRFDDVGMAVDVRHIRLGCGRRAVHRGVGTCGGVRRDTVLLPRVGKAHETAQ